MGKTKDNSPQKDFNIKLSRRIKTEKISRLRDYKKSYDADMFIEDLINYFDNEVDFNLTKIRQEVEKSNRLPQLIKKAKAKSTHPVTEFIQELFEDLGRSGDIKWSGEW